jgi:hypothetical protein
MRPLRTSHLPLRGGRADRPVSTGWHHKDTRLITPTNSATTTERGPDQPGFYSHADGDTLSSDIVGRACSGSCNPTPFHPVTGPSIAVAAPASLPPEEPVIFPPARAHPPATCCASPTTRPARSDFRGESLQGMRIVHHRLPHENPEARHEPGEQPRLPSRHRLQPRGVQRVRQLRQDLPGLGHHRAPLEEPPWPGN